MGCVRGPAIAASDPYVRRVEFGSADLLTYLIDDGAEVVVILDITLAGKTSPQPAGQED
jgi:hypothetical protein